MVGAVVAQLEPSHRVLQFDPQGHRMGPVGTRASQVALGWGLMWLMGAVQDLFLPPSIGVLSLMLAAGAMLLAPRRVIREFPISLSLLGLVTITIASIMWSVDPVATQANLRALLPATLGVIIVGGLLTLRDVADALIWTIRIVLALTFAALVMFPATRVHVINEEGLSDYAGWHGFFNHKNNMVAFLVLAIPTILVFHREGIIKWLTLGAIGVLMVGSTSATGLSAGFFVVVAWIWLQLYQRQSAEDARNSTLLALVSVLGSAAVVGVAASSVATVTSAYGKDTTFSGRTEIWQATVDAIAREPWLGHGFLSLFWRDRVSPETAEIWRQVGFDASHAHNGALDLTLQIGLIGLGVFLLLWVTIMFRAWRALPTQTDLAIWVLCVMTANLLMSLSEDVMYGGWLAVFGLLKMLLMRRQESLDRPSLGSGPVDKWAYR